MKQIENNRYCSIIEDLLPLYVEDLVSKDTRQEIEEHIKRCNKCAEILKTMQKDGAFNTEEIIKEDSNKDVIEKEIKCIKNIKRKIAFKVIISIVITCIIFIIAINLWNTYRIIKDEDGKWILYNFNTGNIKQGPDYTNMLMEYTENKLDLNGNNIIENNVNKETVEHYILLTFNKKDICVNAREIISGYDEEELQTAYKWYADTWKHSHSNVKIENGKLYMNSNFYVGKTKDKLINNSKDYEAKITEF